VDDTATRNIVDLLLRRIFDANHADATRYHVTDYGTPPSDEEPRHDDDEQDAAVEGSVWPDEFWSTAWTLFVTLDLLLVVARATVTYVGATEIYGGCRQTHPASYQPSVPAANHCIANGQVGSAAACARGKTDDHAIRRSSWSLVDAMSSRSLLVVVHLSALVALLYLAARIATSSAVVDVVVDTVFDVHSQQVRAYLSMSDAVVGEQARFTTSSLMQSAQHFDLLALRVFDQYFRLGICWLVILLV